MFSVVDVISIEKTGENFRLIYDVKGRFTVHRITNEEAKVSSLSVLLGGYIIEVKRLLGGLFQRVYFLKDHEFGPDDTVAISMTCCQ